MNKFIILGILGLLVVAAWFGVRARQGSDTKEKPAATVTVDGGTTSDAGLKNEHTK